MKFKIDKDHFAAGLSQVLGVVSARASMPILGNVLIEAEGDTVSLTTTNLDLGIRCRMKANVTSGGTITLPVKKLATIVNLLPAKEVVVEISGQNRARITCGGSKFEIMGMPSDQFPGLNSFTDQHSYTLPQAVLGAMIKRVSYAQSTDENRFTLNGVFFNFADGKLTLVATDGRRLAITAEPLASAAENTGNLILPAKTVAAIQKMLGDAGEVKIAFNDRQVSFQVAIVAKDAPLTDRIHLVSKVVDGSYPNYKQVIPKETVHRVSINREDLLGCVTRAALMTSEKNTSVKLAVADAKLTLTASSAEYGESQEELAIQYSGPAVQIAFNPSYIQDPLRALADDEIAFDFKDDMSPGVIRNGADFLCVVMPQRIG